MSLACAANQHAHIIAWDSSSTQRADGRGAIGQTSRHEFIDRTGVGPSGSHREGFLNQVDMKSWGKSLNPRLAMAWCREKWEKKRENSARLSVGIQPHPQWIQPHPQRIQPHLQWIQSQPGHVGSWLPVIQYSLKWLCLGDPGDFDRLTDRVEEYSHG